jgi:hypothetical protein
MNTGLKAIVAAFVSAYETAENTGSKLADVCKIANATYKGKEVPDEDAENIVQALCDARGWTEKSAKVRKSEARKVLGVYNVLPEGIKHLRDTNGACNWRDALKLATGINKHEGKLKPALSEFKKQPKDGGKGPQGRVAGALKAWYKEARGDKKQKILEAAALLNIKLGVKLDA